MSNKLVALTFDDGPCPGVTERVLDTLRQYGAHATFFMLGENVEKYGDLVQRVYREGHQIGNHSWSHEWFTKIDEKEMRSSLENTQNEIEKACGKRPFLHRPPYGDIDDNTFAVIGSCDLSAIIWSIDPKDWKRLGAEVTFENVVNKSEDGDIILLHDIHEQTADALKMIMPKLVEKGFEFVTIEDLAKAKGITLEPGHYYTNFNGKEVIWR